MGGMTLAAEPEIIIERLPEARWGDYRNLRLESLREEPLAFISSYEDEVDFGESVWRARIKNALFATSDGVPVGVLVYLVRSRQKENHVSDIFGVYVRKRFRGEGIGGMLMNRALKEIMDKGVVRKVSLNVVADQIAAVSLYRKFGFAIAGTLKEDVMIGGNTLMHTRWS